MTHRRPSLLRRLYRFRRDESGSMTVEACLILPVWLWVWIMCVQFFDAFRTHTVNLRATYTVADMISRETSSVGPKYIANMKSLFDYVSRATRPTTLRVTSVYYDSTKKAYRVNWSYAVGGTTTVQTDTSIAKEAARIPNLLEGETLVLVETHMDYDPTFNIGINDIDYDYFITTAPRFASQVSYSASS
ncbi:pilus assembly protein [Frigidibacter sp. MR17.14]|uniref:TadE/TadG family type IV pilus assembly protein n=1 Tax=Frigidibacter sp. MR17.14 TaxID=3126509 RepID=UPI003012FD87